ncbi:MAG TPA: GTP cyclohydrolase I FolE [Planctomycetes bacterium]|nr:GTP cyclohydrolase I FolE [Planctomycetota bacterium]
MSDSNPSSEENLARIADLTHGLIEAIGEDASRPGLLKTPQRVANAWMDLTAGYRVDLSELLNGAVFDEDANEMVVVQDIEMYSLCEHHFLPFYGKCHVAYIPDGKIIGLSKLPRIVDAYARRVQVQERLTTQIANAVQELLQPLGVAVVIEAFHLCMMMRGVQKQNATTKTSTMLGHFRSNSKTRAEFLSILNRRL